MENLIDDLQELIPYLNCIKRGRYEYNNEAQLLPERYRLAMAENKPIKPKDLTQKVVLELLYKAGIEAKKEFQIDDICFETYNKIALYLRKDEDFEKIDPVYNSSYKGIIIMGKVGCGKTMLLQSMRKVLNAFSYNCGNLSDYVQNYRIVNTNEICQLFSIKGFEVMDNVLFTDKYSSKFSLNSDHLMIDDLGAEPSISHYGNQINIVGEVIQMRYERRQPTHGSTNLDVKSLRELYGERVFSRMKEMFNFIPMPGGDRRK